MILPHIHTPGIALEATRTRTGREVHAEFADRGVRGIDRRDVLSSPTIWPNRRMQEISAQFFVRVGEERALLGYVSLHEFNPNSGYVKCAVTVDREAPEDVHTAVVALTVNYAFAMWSIRKLYFWTPEPEVRGLAATGAVPAREGTLPEHLLDEGTLRPVNVFALYRAQWEETGVAFVESLVAGAGIREYLVDRGTS
ncbi:hypothetical protein ACIQFP_01625 [Nocardiopsis alba]|uniref:hypothetical protein n=1 Tax=Nocardiopsis alba TaxID=53437 RepID=UPI0037FEE687